MKRFLLALALLGVAAVPVLRAELAWAAPSSAEILAAVDKNLTFDSRSTRVTMTVVKANRTKVYEMMSYGRGEEEGATEFLSPPREAGTRMLKKGDELWIYMPSVEKVQKLSGHMLREGMMGSDISYEDLLEASAWRSAYNAAVLADETVNGRPCWVLDLTAKTPDIAYPRRKVWVDQGWSLPVRQELYALSGTLLKVWTMSDPLQFGARWYPTKMVVEDKLLQGSSTTVVFSEMKFSVPLQEEVFSLRWLER